MTKKINKKTISIVLGLVLLFLFYKFFLRGITAQSIRDWVNGFGVLAPIAYIFVWAVLPVFFFPVPILALAGGLSFGLMPEKWWNRFMKLGKRDGFFVVFICRLIPVMPYNVINYASGLTEISFVSYSLATILGILPGTVIFLDVGDKILDIRSPEFIWSIVFVVLLTIISIMLGKYVSKKADEKEKRLKKS